MRHHCLLSSRCFKRCINDLEEECNICHNFPKYCKFCYFTDNNTFGQIYSISFSVRLLNLYHHCFLLIEWTTFDIHVLAMPAHLQFFFIQEVKTSYCNILRGDDEILHHFSIFERNQSSLKNFSTEFFLFLQQIY